MACLMAQQAIAGQQLQRTDLLALQPGAQACWQREYDRSHLAGHPDQTVIRMALSLDVAPDGQANDPELGFGISVQRRGEGSTASAIGLCYDHPQGVACYSDCDGGGFLLRRARKPGAVLLDMRHVGRLRLLECGEDQDVDPKRAELVPGVDDQVFLLFPTDPGSCSK